jgi:tetratricopeptide (TPR) repeat protein
MPYLLCSSETAPDAPPAGYCDEETTIGLRTLLSTRYIFWQMQHLPDAAPTILCCLVRAALYILHTRNFNASVRYLLDLHKHGYLLSSALLQHCLVFLFEVRQRVARDEDIVPLCIGLRDGAAGWRSAELLPVDLQALPMLREAAEGLAYLLQTADNDIDEVRAARSYDEWVLGQHYLTGLMMTAHFLLGYLDMQDEPAFIAFDVRYEEIVADGFAYYHMLRGAPERYPFEMKLTYSYAIIKAAQMGGGDWQDRLCDERVVVPDQLADLLLPNDGTINLQPAPDSIPVAWRLLSAAVAPVYALLVVREPGYRALARTDGQTGSGPTDLQSLIRAIRQDPENQQLRAQLLDRHPYCDQCLFIEALYLDRCGEQEAAMARLQQAILIDPSDHHRWHSAGVLLHKLGHVSAAVRLKGFALTLRDNPPAAPSFSNMPSSSDSTKTI